MAVWTLGSARSELTRVLDDEIDLNIDPDAVASWSDTLKNDAINAALIAFSAHTAVATSTGFTGDGDATSYTMPDNMIEGGYVYVYSETDEEWWEQMSYQSIGVRPRMSPMNYENFVYEWPVGVINFNVAPDDGDIFTMYYYAYWDEVTQDADTIGIPKWAREAVICYSAAYVMHAAATAASNLGQFRQSLDAGNPEHNPFERRQQAFLKRYEYIISRYTSQDRSPPWEVD